MAQLRTGRAPGGAPGAGPPSGPCAADPQEAAEPDSPTYAPQRKQRGDDRGFATTANNLATAGAVRARRGGAAKLKARRGGLSGDFGALQDGLATDVGALSVVSTRAAGLKHIGFGPFKRENQDEFFIQVGHYGSQPGANLFCVFDGHGPHGKDAAACSRQVLPALLEEELKRYFHRNADAANSEYADATRGAVELIMGEVFGQTERNLTKAGVNLAASGTTASVAYQLGNRLWIASAGDSRAVLCSRASPGSGRFRARPLTIDHRPRRPCERERVQAAGARVHPKRLASGRLVGEPRLWLQEVASPGLLLSRSVGDLMAATVGCTSDPEITYVTLEPGVDQFVVIASDGVWDVLSNEQVCDIVAESPDPHIAARRVLDAALYEWEERMSADNITVLVVEFDWRWVVQDLPPGATQSPETAMAAVARAITESGPCLAGGDHLPAIRENPYSGEFGDAPTSGDW
ncbi:MAG: phosphatase 2C-like domain-containing protein [Monoraphidium minutum]|nr:MAG: phosphatase 2C-like domain-containing protein [Monoraphidium minutum]